MFARQISNSLLTGVMLILFAGAAIAQVPRGMGPLTADQQGLAQNGDNSSRRIEEATVAIQSKNYSVADGLLEDALRHDPRNAHANFLMGIAKMGLEKWSDAKMYLEIAVKKSPKDPDPKSRLAVTLIKLGDIDGAMAQRSELAKMSDTCKGACRNAQWIASGLSMIDAALLPGPAS
jgi:Tfp pilus assembly protein PilF